MYIEQGFEMVTFENQPYSGYIEENTPHGSEIQGLENVKKSVQKFPYGCVVSITGSI